MAHRDILGTRSNYVAFGVKRTFARGLIQTRIYWFLAQQCAGLLQFPADAGDVLSCICYLLVKQLLPGFFQTGSLMEQEIAMASQSSKTVAPGGVPARAELLTPKEYAKAAKVSLSWLAKARKRGDGPPFVRFGRSVRYSPPRMPE